MRSIHHEAQRNLAAAKFPSFLQLLESLHRTQSEDARPGEALGWAPAIPLGFDMPLEVSRAGKPYLQRLDRQPISSPLYGAVQIEDFQPVPLLKALPIPRVNLLIADDVGLGKAIEAGLILTELLLRRRIQRQQRPLVERDERGPRRRPGWGQKLGHDTACRSVVELLSFGSYAGRRGGRTMPIKSKRSRRHARVIPRKGVARFLVLVSRDTPATEKIAAIRRGVGARVVDEMVDYLGVPKTVIFAVLHTPESTAHRLIKDNRNLDAAASERVVRVADITRMAEETFGGRQAATQWLKTANVGLGGATPLSLLDTEPGAREVRRILSAIDHGGAL
jgi:putative toxin-antitoxin system antitoxin component (TIGR02293 family)